MARTEVTGNQIKDDSITADDVVEESLLAEKMPFSDPEFVALNVKDAIIESKSSSSVDNKFLYILDKDLTLENNESKIVANKIDCNDNNIRLKGNSILRIS